MAGPPVVLFPSLAGSVLECEESPVKGYEGKRIWMGLNTLIAGAADINVEIKASADSTIVVKHPFVQHLGKKARTCWTRSPDSTDTSVRPEAAWCRCGRV